jgi:hypothetical protein
LKREAILLATSIWRIRNVLNSKMIIDILYQRLWLAEWVLQSELGGQIIN